MLWAAGLNVKQLFFWGWGFVLGRRSAAFFQGYAYLHLGMNEEARGAFQLGLKYDPHNVTCWAFCWCRAKVTVEALKERMQIPKHRHRDNIVHLHLQIYISLQRWLGTKTAVSTLDSGLPREQPWSHEALYGRAE